VQRSWKSPTTALVVDMCKTNFWRTAWTARRGSPIARAVSTKPPLRTNGALAEDSRLFVAGVAHPESQAGVATLLERGLQTDGPVEQALGTALPTYQHRAHLGAGGHNRRRLLHPRR